MPKPNTSDRRIWLLITATALIAALFIPFSQLVLHVHYDYTLRTVALGGALLGIVSGVLGCFAVLRRQSLLGDALSHAALPGVAIAFLLAGRDLGLLLIGAGVTSWLGVWFIRLVTGTTRIKQDAAMGIVLAAWFAAGIALLVYIQARPDASQAGLDTFIFGQAAAIIERDVRLIAAVGAVSFIVLALFWKEFKLITFDPEFAGANGFRVNLLSMTLSTLIVVAIVLGPPARRRHPHGRHAHRLRHRRPPVDQPARPDGHPLRRLRRLRRRRRAPSSAPSTPISPPAP